jgi:RNA polymerase sporulation-specific sigma factor
MLLHNVNHEVIVAQSARRVKKRWARDFEAVRGVKINPRVLTPRTSQNPQSVANKSISKFRRCFMFVHHLKKNGPGSVTEATLFQQAQAGCQGCLNHLMARHDGLVNAVVRQQVLGDLPFDEALQAGRIGLWRAILGYDPTRGTAFSSYAWASIMRQVWREVKEYPDHQPSAVPDDNLPSRCQPDPALLWEAQEIRQALHELVQRLPQRMRQVIVLRYGLDGSPPSGYRQIGSRLGLSHELARLLHRDALVWMRHPAYSQVLRSMLGLHTTHEYELTAVLAQDWLRHRGGRDGR